MLHHMQGYALQVMPGYALQVMPGYTLQVMAGLYHVTHLCPFSRFLGRAGGGQGRFQAKLIKMYALRQQIPSHSVSSSVAERCLAKAKAEGSTPFFRFELSKSCIKTTASICNMILCLSSVHRLLHRLRTQTGIQLFMIANLSLAPVF